MSDQLDIVTTILNGGGTLALAIVVWWELRKLVQVVRDIEIRLIEALGKNEARQRQVLERLRDADDCADSIPPRRHRTRRESD